MRKKSYIILGRCRDTNEIYGVNAFGLSRNRVDLHYVNDRYYKAKHALYHSGNKQTAKNKRKAHVQMNKYQHQLFIRLNAKIKRLNIMYDDFDFFISRCGSDKCPVKINWDKAHENKAWLDFKTLRDLFPMGDVKTIDVASFSLR